MKWTVQLQLYLSGAWQAIPLYSAAPTKSVRGNAPYTTSSWPRPAEFSVEINNDTLAYDPERPESVLYGVAGRSTPARLRVGAGLVLRSQAEAAGYKAVRTGDHKPAAKRGRSSVLFTAAGPLQRLQGWTDLVASPMLVTITARSTRIGHWPMEEDPRASVLGNTVAGGTSGTVAGGPEFAQSDRPAGARQTLRSVSGCRLSGTFVAAPAAPGWQLSISLKVPTLPPTGSYARILRWTTSNGYSWTLEYGAVGFRLVVTDAAGSTLLSSSPGYSTWPPTQWITMRVRVTESAGTVTAAVGWYVQGADATTGVTGSFSGTAGALRAWSHDGSGLNAGALLSHLYGLTGITEDPVDLNGLKSFNGFDGEYAAVRYQRIVSQVLPGMAAWVAGDALDQSARMGPQPVASLIDILRDCRDTDGGRLDDARSDNGFNMIPLKLMRGREPILTLVYPSDVMPPFETDPASNYVANTVTAKNRDGGEATKSLTSGAMSTQLAPAGVGESKTTVNVNLADERFDLPARASWELARGTIAGRQFRSVTVSLDNGTVTEVQVNSVDLGDPIKIVGYPPDDIYLWVTGITDNVAAGLRSVTFDTESYEVMRVGTWGDGTGASVWRWGLGQLTVDDVTSTPPTWIVSSPERFDLLNPGSGKDLQVSAGGERARVTAAGAVTVAAGLYTQSWTVVRSINGVIKAQTAGTPVVAVDARRWGL
jgi:hypothetical protein